MKERQNNMLAFVGDEANYLHHGRSSPYHCYKSPQSLHDVIDADTDYHKVELHATNHIAELAPRP